MSAERHNEGKLKLHHIHPSVWGVFVGSQLLDNIGDWVVQANYAFDQAVYYGNASELAYVVDIMSESVLDEMARVLEFGSQKYASLNYAKGMPYSELTDSFRRHIKALCYSQELDEESGLLHIGHIACNFMFLLTYELTKVGTNDIPTLKEDSNE